MGHPRPQPPLLAPPQDQGIKIIFHILRFLMHAEFVIRRSILVLTRGIFAHSLIFSPFPSRRILRYTVDARSWLIFTRLIYMKFCPPTASPAPVDPNETLVCSLDIRHPLSYMLNVLIDICAQNTIQVTAQVRLIAHFEGMVSSSSNIASSALAFAQHIAENA